MGTGRGRTPSGAGGARKAMAASIGLVAFLTSGCATYSPDPLRLDAPLEAPLAGALAADSATISRPYLKPVALDLRAPLDLNAVAVLAVIGNPDLRAMRVRARVADAQLFSARLLPDPTLSLGIDQVVSGPPALANLAGTLGFAVNELRTRGARIAGARAETQRVRLDLAWAEWQTAGKARIQAVRVIGTERALAIARASSEVSQSLLDRSLRAAGRGDLPPDQLQAARLAVFDAAQRVRTLEREFEAARFELTRLLGLAPGETLRLSATVDARPIPSLETLFSMARAQRLDLQALEAGYKAQEAAVRLAVIRQFPTLDISLNGTRDTSGNGLVGPAVSLTLPLWNRNRGAIAVETATRTALKAEFESRLFQTRAEIAAAAAALAVSSRQRSLIESSLPALKRFAEASRRAADRGDIALATAQAAEQALRDKQLLLAQSEQDMNEQLIALELLAGMPRESWPR